MKRIIRIICFFLLSACLCGCGALSNKNVSPKNNDPYVVPTPIPVLLYHDFVKALPSHDSYDLQYVNTPEWLDENIGYLQKRGYTFISFEELYVFYTYGIALPEKPIVLTFDDGNIGQYELAYPMLKKHDVKATFFVVTDWVGKTIDDQRYFSWEQARLMKHGNAQIYSHNSQHVFLKSADSDCVLSSARASFDALERALGTSRLKVFAYPYGSFSPTHVRTLEENGVDMQVYGIGMNYSDSLDPSHIQRICVPFAMSGKSIEEIIIAQTIE